MRRREFIAALGGAAAWPLSARAQQPALPVVAYLIPGEGGVTGVSPDFRNGLSEMGYVDGRNVAIEIHLRSTDQSGLPALATELVRRRVAVIFAGPPVNGALAAKAATATIPIVFNIGQDPVRLGLVASMNHPGGNITGVSTLVTALLGKRLEMLRELVPQATTIGYLTNPTNSGSAESVLELQAAARSVGQQITVLKYSTAAEIDAAFVTAAEQGVGALLVDGTGLGRDQIIVLAARYRFPASYNNTVWVQAGGLMTYVNDRAETFRQSGVYVGRILRGEKPGDLPVVQPTRFKLVVNLKTAKALGLTIPETLLATADEVIQ
jgi:putative ABC transport system substrate-binding protein